MKLRPDQPVPARLPKSKAARFRVCTTLATAIQDLGFDGELGYDQFLYPNDKDTRSVLMWLVNKLPKSDEAAGDEEDDAMDTMAKTRAGMKAWYVSRYDAFVNNGAATSTGLKTTQLMTPDSGDDPNKFETLYVKKYQQLVSVQPPKLSGLAPSLMELNVRDVCLAQERQAAFDAGEVSAAEKLRLISERVARAFNTERMFAEQRSKKLQDIMGDIMKRGADGALDSQFNRKVAFEQETDSSAQVVQDGGTVRVVSEGGDEVKDKTDAEDEEAIRKRQDERLAELKEEIEALKQQVQKILNKMEEFSSQARQIDGDVNAGAQDVKQLEEKYKLQKRLLKLLPDADKNLRLLRKICTDSEARILKMGDQWEAFRVPQIDKYRRQKQKLDERKNEVRKKVDQIRRMRAEMKQMVQDVRRKDELYKQLVAELNKLPKSVNRQEYIRRIMNIMGNLDKQKAQIKAILSDVRALQKDINSVADTSARSFKKTDQVVYTAAKSGARRGSSDATGVKAYESLSKLRDGFDRLVLVVEDTGRARGEIRALETQIESLESQNTALNMKRVAEDLKQIKEENKGLSKKLRKIRAVKV